MTLDPPTPFGAYVLNEWPLLTKASTTYLTVSFQNAVTFLKYGASD